MPGAFGEIFVYTDSIQGGNKMKNITRILIILLGLLALVVVFLTADFNFARSETTSEHNLTTIRQGDEIPTPIPIEQILTVAVVGEGAFADRLREAILAELTASNLATQGQWIATSDAGSDALHLLVRVDHDTFLWTPVYAQATVNTTLGYASNHDLSWYGTFPVSMETDHEAPLLWATGEFELSDSSSGLISRPAYQRILAEKIATEMVQALGRIYTQGG
jgi:hypothetical protein